jgi:hypothetical protein
MIAASSGIARGTPPHAGLAGVLAASGPGFFGRQPKLKHGAPRLIRGRPWTAAIAAEHAGFIPPYRVKTYVEAAQEAAIPE